MLEHMRGGGEGDTRWGGAPGGIEIFSFLPISILYRCRSVEERNGRLVMSEAKSGGLFDGFFNRIPREVSTFPERKTGSIKING